MVWFFVLVTAILIISDILPAMTFNQIKIFCIGILPLKVFIPVKIFKFNCCDLVVI